MLKVISKLKPKGDQPKAISQLSKNVFDGIKHQTLLGVTGSGKTFTVAHTIAKTKKPTLVISHNKTLAHQLYQEFKEFMPEASVHYFVSYYDYYQPEAYIPQTDTYIEKDVKINEELDKLRHEATQAILSRDDVLVVASVSCIYNIGSPKTYENLSLTLVEGQNISQKELLKNLVLLQYTRNEFERMPGSFSKKGELIEIISPTGNFSIKIELPKNKVKKIYISKDKHLTFAASFKELKKIKIFPAKFWVTEQDNIDLAIANIKAELTERIKELKKQGKLLEAQRLKQRTEFDLEMLKETGYCHGIENYSSHLEFRERGSPPFTLIDYFHYAYQDNFLIVIDESHITIPQIRGMYNGDRTRKETLIEHGFRLPSAKDNRPLKFSEFEKLVPQAIYVSATPEKYELKKSNGYVVEQIIRPTGLLDPKIIVKKSKNQIEDIQKEIKKRIKRNERVLITVLTKRMAEDLADFLKENGIKAHYLHSETKTLQRPEVITDLRKGDIDVLVGVNLLREGLDIPEVSLVIIVDADKEGFLRNTTTLIQTMGRAARNVNGTVIMYADKITESMQRAIEETERRRKIQEEYNKKHNIKPTQIKKEIRENVSTSTRKKEAKEAEEKIIKEILNLPHGLLAQAKDKEKIIKLLTKEMKKAAGELDFEKAEKIKNIITKLKK